MKITHVVGSPRRQSDSAKIAAAFCEAAGEKGAVINTHVLNNMDFKGCQGCFGCKRGKGICVVKDDLHAVLDEVAETDVLIVSAPVYCMDIPGQAKCFFDRLTSFFEPHEINSIPKSKLKGGKTAVFVQTQGAPEQMFQEVYQRYLQYFSILGFENVHAVRAAGFTDPEVTLSPDTLAEARELALNLA